MSEYLVIATRVVMGIIGVCAFYRIVFNRYIPGDYVRFSMGIAATAAINMMHWRGYAEAANYFYVFVSCVLIYFINTERKALK